MGGEGWKRERVGELRKKIRVVRERCEGGVVGVLEDFGL